MRKRHGLLAMIVWANLFSASSISFAAEECITESKTSGPGKHWFYHVDPVSHRKCWFESPTSIQTDHAAPQSQSVSKPKRKTAVKAPGTKRTKEANIGDWRETLFREFLQWREQQPQSVPEKASRDALLREFVRRNALQASNRE